MLMQPTSLGCGLMVFFCGVALVGTIFASKLGNRWVHSQMPCIPCGNYFNFSRNRKAEIPIKTHQRIEILRIRHLHPHTHPHFVSESERETESESESGSESKGKQGWRWAVFSDWFSIYLRKLKKKKNGAGTGRNPGTHSHIRGVQDSRLQNK